LGGGRGCETGKTEEEEKRAENHRIGRKLGKSVEGGRRTWFGKGRYNAPQLRLIKYFEAERSGEIVWKQLRKKRGG